MKYWIRTYIYHIKFSEHTFTEPGREVEDTIIRFY